MDDPGAMGLGQCGRDLDANVDRGGGGERTASDQLAQGLSIDELIGNEMRAGRVADVVNRDDVRVIERRSSLRFLIETGKASAVLGQFFGQHL